MNSVSLEEAQASLPELIHRLAEGEELLITENDHPVAKVLPLPKQSTRPARPPGTLRGTVLYMAPDFDAPLDDFAEYME